MNGNDVAINDCQVLFWKPSFIIIHPTQTGELISEYFGMRLEHLAELDIAIRRTGTHGLLTVRLTLQNGRADYTRHLEKKNGMAMKTKYEIGPIGTQNLKSELRN